MNVRSLDYNLRTSIRKHGAPNKTKQPTPNISLRLCQAIWYRNSLNFVENTSVPDRWRSGVPIRTCAVCEEHLAATQECPIERFSLISTHIDNFGSPPYAMIHVLYPFNSLVKISIYVGFFRIPLILFPSRRL